VLKSVIESTFNLVAALFRAIPELITLLCRLIRQYAGRRKGGEGTPIDCLPVPPDIYLRPDASLYSQSYLMSLGMAVTWDNPDIVLTDASNNPVASHELAPNTQYTVTATIHNRSNDAPAISMPVVFSLLHFGVGGTTLQSIGTAIIDLPVRGAPGEPAVAQTSWTTPAAPGHFCLQVEAVWNDDANPLDNIGQENTVVGHGRPGDRLSFSVPVRNRLQATRRFNVRLHSYVLPERPLLVETTSVTRPRQETFRQALVDRGRAQLLRRVVAANAPEQYPAPEDWEPLLTRETLRLESDETTAVDFSVTIPPTAVAGSLQPFTIVVTEEESDRLIGGVTVLCEVE